MLMARYLFVVIGAICNYDLDNFCTGPRRSFVVSVGIASLSVASTLLSD